MMCEFSRLMFFLGVRNVDVKLTPANLQFSHTFFSSLPTYTELRKVRLNFRTPTGSPMHYQLKECRRLVEYAEEQLDKVVEGKTGDLKWV